MKLRNKKTGEVATLDSEHTASLADFGGKLLLETQEKEFSYATLAELNEEWEDYEPKEPLIKDEKIRKAVRAWAEANDIDGATFYMSSHFWYLRTFNDREQGIDFWLKWDDKPNLIESKYYYIEELCGEDE